jgi:NADH dehydrogenase FAD-containing subunit
MNFDSKDHATMSLRSWVNVILGKMTSIDRRHKNIVINGQTILPYDHLILCTGEQYYNIAPHNARVYNAYTKQEVKPFNGRPLFGMKYLIFINLSN